jgi:hypothetical protein
MNIYCAASCIQCRMLLKPDKEITMKSLPWKKISAFVNQHVFRGGCRDVSVCRYILAGHHLRGTAQYDRGKCHDFWFHYRHKPLMLFHVTHVKQVTMVVATMALIGLILKKTTWSPVSPVYSACMTLMFAFSVACWSNMHRDWRRGKQYFLKHAPQCAAGLPRYKEDQYWQPCRLRRIVPPR